MLVATINGSDELGLELLIVEATIGALSGAGSAPPCELPLEYLENGVPPLNALVGVDGNLLAAGSCTGWNRSRCALGCLRQAAKAAPRTGFPDQPFCCERPRDALRLDFPIQERVVVGGKCPRGRPGGRVAFCAGPR